MSTEAGRIATFTASDGYVLRYRHYPAEGTPRGRVVCLPGIQSHGGWYTASCAYLARQGWDVTFLDRRGSGLNEPARGDTPDHRRLVADIAEFIQGNPTPQPPPRSGEGEEERSCSPSPRGGRGGGGVRGESSPPFLVAISWGGKLAVTLERRHPGLTRGLVLVAPGLCPRVKPPLGHRLGIAWSRLVAPGRLFPIPLDDPQLFTASPSWQQFIRDDPLSLRRATARLLVASVFLDIAARRSKGHVRVPVLLLLAGKDRIIDNAKTRAYVQQFATTDKEVIEYPDAHHTLEFEPDPTPVFADVARWLERQAG